MKVLHGNSFLYFGDKNVSKVSGVWKALHISIYVAIAVTAFVTSMAVGNMFQTFKYNCILFCDHVGFETEIVSREHSEILAAEYKKHSLNNENITPNQTIAVNGSDQNMFLNETLTENNSTTNTPNSSTQMYAQIPKAITEEPGHIIFKNKTHIFEYDDGTTIISHAKIDVRKTRFRSSFWCNFVLGIALVTFIFATFCVVILAMCSKGGTGRENTLNRPQNMLYPILVSSLALGILNFAASLTVKNGMQEFCANFELFTEDKRCSPMINQFTLHERQDRFYLPYIVLSYSFPLTIILFVCQVLVTLLRIVYAVDYQLYALEVDDNEEEEDFETDDGHVKEIRL